MCPLVQCYVILCPLSLAEIRTHGPLVGVSFDRKPPQAFSESKVGRRSNTYSQKQLTGSASRAKQSIPFRNGRRKVAPGPGRGLGARAQAQEPMKAGRPALSPHESKLLRRAT